ncbi:gelsolin-like [Hyposmocoma kahamanoa]|uniref:gelsolin-like n=1 Tax=Hyposmocoma kahamanoa TaxID=1477025 RepID=UPI000E6D8531|nr:gelsolin-like [Hyposmocoma kahamanoa]
MDHPAFADAGGEPGIEIWTIETSGDNNSTYSYDAHFWLGSKTTQDKKGSAAILTVTLDDMLGGKAVHHREIQGHESSQFLGYFKPAIRYLEGGNESGFTEVDTNAGAEKRLLRLSGCENMRIEEVPADSTSLTKEHCFILEVDHDIFVLVPEGAKATHRRKIISVANKLRDDDHNGRATIEIIDEFSSDDDVALFFEALGSGSKDDLPDFQSSDSFSRTSPTEVFLYKVLVGDEIELVAMKKPYKQKHLSSDEIYVLDTPDSGIFLWLGKDVDPEVKKNYHDIAQKTLEINEYPSWLHVTRMSEGSESSTFKQYFHSWDIGTTNFSAELDAGYASGDEPEAAAYKIGKSAAARGYMPDKGEGNLVVTRFAGDQEDITEKVTQELTVFYNSDVYVLKYKYTDDNGEDACVVYVWMGAKSKWSDKNAAIQFGRDIEQEEEGSVTVIKVPQGKEPKHLLSVFKGNLVVVMGSKDNDYNPENSKGTYDDDNIRLFKVEGTEIGVDMRAIQVPEKADVLEADDVFVLETKDVVYVRNGKESDPKEQEIALNFVKLVVGDTKEVTVLEQGDEPDEFWEALGGAPEEKEDASDWRSSASRRVTTPASLTAVTVTMRGKILFEELPPKFTQEDLSDDGAYILDKGEELYLWQGKNIPKRVKDARTEIIQEYIKDDGLDRTADTALVVMVKQGKEPKVFRNKFPSWDNDMWNNQTSYEDMKNNTKAANSK